MARGDACAPQSFRKLVNTFPSGASRKSINVCSDGVLTVGASLGAGDSAATAIRSVTSLR